MNDTMIFGIILAAAGAAVFIAAQIMLRRWIKRYNKEWYGGADKL